MQSTKKRLMVLATSAILLYGLFAGSALAADGTAQPMINGGNPGNRGKQMQQGNGQGTPPEGMPGDGQRGGGGDRNGIGMGLVGKIAVIADGTVSLYMAALPEMPDVTRLVEGETPPEQPQQGAQPPNDHTQAQPGEMPQMEFRFASETTSYTLTEGVKVQTTKGNDETVGSVNDLAAGDTVRLTLNEAGEVITIEKVNSAQEQTAEAA